MSSRADAAAGAAGALFLFAGPPAVAFLGLPPAGAHVSWAEVLMHLRAFTLPTSVVLSGLAAVAALAWAAYAAATLADLVRLARGQTPRLAVARLVAALLAALAASPAAHAATDEATAPAPALPQNQSDAPASTDAPGPADPIERHRSVEGFAVDSAHLTPDMRAALASTAELISAYGDPGSAITVTGHTDPTGPAAHNADLSQRRAQAAASYLQKAVGEGFTITAEGRGPATPANGVQDYAAMRRVEVDYRLRPPRRHSRNPRLTGANLPRPRPSSLPLRTTPPWQLPPTPPRPPRPWAQPWPPASWAATPWDGAHGAPPATPSRRRRRRRAASPRTAPSPRKRKARTPATMHRHRRPTATHFA